MRLIYNFFCTYQAISHCLQLFFKQTFPSSQGGVSDKFKRTSAFRLLVLCHWLYLVTMAYCIILTFAFASLYQVKKEKKQSCTALLAV